MSTVEGPALSIHHAYERWAESYPPEPHNPLMRLEQRVMIAQLPPVAQKNALDLACGSGRYAALLQAAGVATVVALDFSRAMLRRAAIPRLIQADMVNLPFRANTFDLVVSGLAIGHATDIYACAAGIARVLRPTGTFLYSDFHPLAAKAGMTRSWSARGRTYALPRDGYELHEHCAALAEAGFEIETLSELRVGIELQERFSGCEDFYRRWHGLPVVLVVKARR